MISDNLKGGSYNPVQPRAKDERLIPSDNLNKAVEEMLEEYFVMRAARPTDDLAILKLRNEAGSAEQELAQALLQLINNEKIEAVNDALAKSEEAKQPSVSKPLTLDRLKDLVGGNLRKNEPDYGRRQFVMGYNQAKDEIRERILTW